MFLEAHALEFRLSRWCTRLARQAGMAFQADPPCHFKPVLRLPISDHRMLLRPTTHTIYLMQCSGQILMRDLDQYCLRTNTFPSKSPVTPVGLSRRPASAATHEASYHIAL